MQINLCRIEKSKHYSLGGMNTTTYLIVLLCLFSVYPYAISFMLPYPSTSVVAVLILITLLFWGFICGKSINFPRIFNQLVFIQISIWCFYALYHSDFVYITRIGYIVCAYLSLGLINNCPGKLLRFSKFYNNIILLMAIGGTICFFLFLFGLIQPFFTYQNADTRTAYCFGLTTTNYYIGNVMRYAGFFDEPGAMAFWGIFALLINKLWIQNKVYEFVLSICLIFTLSMAYYIQMVIYVIGYKIRSIKQALVCLSLIFFIGGTIYALKDTEYNYLYTLTFERFEADESTGTLKGDNRTELSELAKAEFIKHPILGGGISNILNIGYMADNPYETLANDGILGTLIIYLPIFLLWYMSKGNKDLKIAVTILILGYLQRPYHVNLLHPFMLYMFLLLAIYHSKAKSNLR